MSDEPSPPIAWQPLTPQGVANFANATWSRLLLVQFIVAVFVAACVIWLLNTHYAPMISAAVQRTTENTRLVNGKLENAPAALLANGKFLSILSNAAESNESGTGDVLIQFELSGWNVCSLLGCLYFDYPPGTTPLAPSTLEPWWGAWKPAILSGIGAVVIVWLMLVWLLLGLIYTPIPLVIAFFSDRQCSFAGSWRLAGASHLPGALFASAIIVLYGLQAFDLVRFMIFFILHLLVSLIFLFAAPFLLPRLSEKKHNPFGTRA
jgi:hypothetical protein